jgi:hypothetical protein
LNPLDAYGPPKPASGDAGIEASVDAGPSCVLARWPDRPAADDPAGADVELTFASSSVDIGGGASATVGYDLDGFCTCPGPSSCTPPGAKPPCDGDGGADNGGGAILSQSLPLLAGAGSADDVIRAGLNGFLVVLQRYNGTANDTDVIVSIFPSNGTEPADGSATPTTPRHDGSDRWTVDPDALTAPAGAATLPVSKLVDPHGYVRDDVVVARMNVLMRLGDVAFDLRGGVVTAQIVREGPARRLVQGVVAGRWPTARLLTSLDAVPDPFDDKSGLCGTDSLYATIKSQVCAAPDVAADPSGDGTTAACDAVAVTIGFSAEPAVVGVPQAARALKHLCGDAWSDACGK